MNKLYLLILIPVFTFAQKDSTDGFLKKVSFAKPFIADMHGFLSKFEISSTQVSSEYNLDASTSSKNKSFKKLVEAHVVVDMPLYGTSFWDANNKKAFEFAVTLPIGFHLIEDMFDNTTAPVIDVDYKFGGPQFKAIKYINNNHYIKNVSLSWIPLFHECTHLGDEITIYRMEKDFPIRRLNISYEFTELQITINDANGSRDNCNSFKIGLLYRLTGRGYGWFSARTDEVNSDSVKINESTRRIEFWASYQMQRSSGFLASKRFVNVFSIEARDRVRYGIPTIVLKNGTWDIRNIQESYAWCFNAYLGYKFFPKTNEKQNFGLFWHAYYGINPYGQLRNIYPYKDFIGVSLTYEPW